MVVFAVKYRLGLLNNDIRLQVYNAIQSISQNHGRGCRILGIGGTNSHIHILFDLSPNISIADYVREIKSRSSRWINENHLTLGRFAWQTGYGAFSYSQSSLSTVMNYVANQEEHHRHKTFKEELEMFFVRYDIVSDVRDMPHEPE